MVPSPSYHLKILMTVTLADWHSFYTRDTLKAVYLKSQLGYSKPAQMQGLKLILTHAVTDVLHIRLATWQHSNQ